MKIVSFRDGGSPIAINVDNISYIVHSQETKTKIFLIGDDDPVIINLPHQEVIDIINDPKWKAL